MHEEKDRQPMLKARLQTSLNWCCDIMEQIKRIHHSNELLTGEATSKMLKAASQPEEKGREPVTTVEVIENLNVQLQDINKFLALEADRLEETV